MSAHENGRDTRVSAMAGAFAQLERAEAIYRQFVADSFVLSNRAAPDEVADARRLAASRMSRPAQLLVELVRNEASHIRLLGQWHALRRTLSRVEIDLAEEEAHGTYSPNEQGRAALEALDEAVSDERERCANLAQEAGMPELARVIRMDST